MMRATDVAFRLGLRRYPRSWRGRCPCCDYSGDTFSVRSGRDGRALLYCANGCEWNELAAAVARATGQPQVVQQDDADVAAKRERNRDRALALWRGSEPAAGTLADRYLTGRELPGLAASAALRFRGDTPHPEGGRLPAMIALVSDVAGTPLGIHRTFLARDGSKSHAGPVKASLGPISGGAIRLEPLTADTPLVIGEGIETSASAGLLLGLPAWAAISRRQPRAGADAAAGGASVVIAVDFDEGGQGQRRRARHGRGGPPRVGRAHSHTGQSRAISTTCCWPGGSHG